MNDSHRKEILKNSKTIAMIGVSSEKKGKVLWLQYGIHHDEAEKIADQANINFISNKCIKQEYQRLFLKSNPVFPVLKN